MRVNITRIRSVIIVYAICGALLAGVTSTPHVGATSPAAYFTSVLTTDGFGSRQMLGGGLARVYSAQAPVWENTSFYNNITTSGSSIFYEVIYVTSGSTTLSFTGDPLNVPQKTSASYNWQESGGFAGSGDIHIRIELWLNKTGSPPVLENAVQFDFLVVLLIVSGWNQSQASVQRGLIFPLRLSLDFANGGNDVMYNTSLALLDSRGLTIQPFVYQLGSLQSGQSVSAAFNVTAPVGFQIGAYTTIFRVSFADFRGVHYAANQTAVINVASLGTEIVVDPEPSVVKVNEYTSVRIVLLDNNLKPVPNAPLNLDVGGMTQVALRTDSSGSALFLYRASNGSGVYLLRTAYQGDSTFAPSTGSSLLTVNPLGTRLSLNVPSNSALGQSVGLSATLLDETGRPVVGANVTFLIDGSPVGWVFTDASGAGVLYYFVKTSGGLSVQASYLGSETYGSANSLVATMFVSPASLFVLGGIDLTLPALLSFAAAILVLSSRSLKARWRSSGSEPHRWAWLRVRVTSSPLDMASFTEHVSLIGLISPNSRGENDPTRRACG